MLAWLNCESRKHGLKCASAKHLLEEGMERVSPVQLAFLQTLTAWLCCCKGPKHQNHNSTCASLMARVPRSSGLPVALSAPRHGDFPRSISGSKLPVCSLRGHAFPALKEICEVKCNLQTTSCAKLQRQSSNIIAKMNLLPIQSSYKQPQARPAFNSV